MNKLNSFFSTVVSGGVAIIVATIAYNTYNGSGLHNKIKSYISKKDAE